MLDPNVMEKAKLVQRGLQQFDSLHSPVVYHQTQNNKDGEKIEDREIVVCEECTDEAEGMPIDFPCHRMMLFMILQGLATLNAAIPSGNMAAVMTRFIGGNQK